ncbi:MAG: YveK family protein [Propionibacteriaceae bacterium]
MIRGVLESLWRRWYITFPGLLVAGLLAVGAWFVVPPSYERSASQFLLPGTGTVPESANPFLYLNGLTQAADVIVRAVGSRNVVHELEQSYPGVEVEVIRDPSTAGPVILITVNARSDADAAQVIDILLKRTQTELEDLQAGYSVAPSDRISVQTITIDHQGTARQRTRLVATVGVFAGVAILAILLAVVVDGLANRRRRKSGQDDAAREAGAPPQGGVQVSKPTETREVSYRSASATAGSEDLVGSIAMPGPE